MNRRSLVSVHAALYLSIALAAVATFLPQWRLWGIHHLAFHGAWARGLALVLVALSLVPAVQRAVFACLRLPARPAAQGALALAAGAGALALFVWQRAATFLLGDGVFITNNLDAATASGVSAGAYLSTLISQRVVYAGTEMLNFLAAGAARSAGSEPTVGLQWVSAVCGALLVAALVAFLAGVRRTRWTAVALLLALSSGAIAIFFGEIESYAPALACGALYVVTAQRALYRRGRLAIPIAFFVLGVLLHVETLVLAPSLLYLVLAHRFGADATRHLRAIVIVTVVGAFLARFVPGQGRHFLGLIDFRDGVLSPAHLADLANLLLLLLPAALVVLALALDPATRPASRAWRRPGAAFTLCLIVPSALFVVLFKPALGMARDWDLFAITSLAWVSAATVVVRHFLARRELAVHHAGIVVPALALSLVLTASWVTVDSNGGRAVARYQSTLEYDRTSLGYASEALAQHFKKTGELERAVAAMDRAFAFRPNLRFLFKASELRFMAGDTLGAIDGMERILERAPSHDDARAFLIGVYMNRDDAARVMALAQDGMAVAPNRYLYPYAYGRALIALGRYDEGLSYFARSMRLGPPRELADEMTSLRDAIVRARGDR